MSQSIGRCNCCDVLGRARESRTNTRRCRASCRGPYDPQEIVDHMMLKVVRIDAENVYALAGTVRKVELDDLTIEPNQIFRIHKGSGGWGA